MSFQDLKNLSIEELKKIKKDEKTNLKKKDFNKYKEDKEKQKLIDDILGIKNREKRLKNLKHRLYQNQNQKKNQKKKHFMIIFLNVLKTKRFLKTLQIILKKSS